MYSVKCKLQFILVMMFALTSLGVMSETYYSPGVSAATMKINGKLYATSIKHSRINRTSKWWKGRGKPPIDKAKAYSFAHAKLISMFPSIVWKERKTTLEYTTGKKGFYTVRFVDSKNTSLGVLLYVLMTGEVSKIKESEQSQNKNYKETNEHKGESYSSVKDAGEIAYEKAVNEAKKMCEKHGGVLNIEQGDLDMPLFKKPNQSKYTVKLTVRYACRN